MERRGRGGEQTGHKALSPWAPPEPGRNHRHLRSRHRPTANKQRFLRAMEKEREGTDVEIERDELESRERGRRARRVRGRKEVTLG